MIVQIDETVFDSTDDEQLKNITRIVQMAFEKRFLWDIENLLIEELKQTYWYKEHLSSIDKKSLEEIMDYIEEQSAYITLTHKHYLTTIIVSNISDSTYLNPSDAYAILKSKSYVILENGTNDWKFIKAIITKYAKHGERRNIYKLIKKHLDNRYLEAIHAGGNINDRLRQEIQENQKPIKRLATIFDSDKSQRDESLKEATMKLIEFLKQKNRDDFSTLEYEMSDLIIWHVLHKRELENYLPIKIINDNYSIENLSAMLPEELDFISLKDKIDFKKDSKAKQNFKNEFPNFFLNDDLTKNQIEQRCEHHKIRVDTPNHNSEQILIKLAKII
jgi:hypothetical protein